MEKQMCYHDKTIMSMEKRTMRTLRCCRMHGSMQLPLKRFENQDIYTEIAEATKNYSTVEQCTQEEGEEWEESADGTKTFRVVLLQLYNWCFRKSIVSDTINYVKVWKYLSAYLRCIFKCM
jgi:hypothetical protein